MERPASLTAFALLLAIVAEAWLIFALASHPAGGWEAEPFVIFFWLCTFVLLPLLGTLVLLMVLPVRGCLRYQPFIMVAALAAIGLLACGLALVGYGHGTPLLLLFGLVIQWSLFLIAQRRFRYET